eukprot:734381-Prorocentrum_minimum.AAC.1
MYSAVNQLYTVQYRYSTVGYRRPHPRAPTAHGQIHRVREPQHGGIHALRRCCRVRSDGGGRARLRFPLQAEDGGAGGGGDGEKGGRRGKSTNNVVCSTLYGSSCAILGKGAHNTPA